MANTVKVQVTLPVETAGRLDELAREKGVSRTAIVSMLINDRWKEEQTET